MYFSGNSIVKRSLLLSLFSISVIACSEGGFQVVDQAEETTEFRWTSNSALEVEAMTILDTKCMSCHQDSNSVGKFGPINSKSRLLTGGYIVAGENVNSLLYGTAASNHGTVNVEISLEEKETLRAWINIAVPQLGLPPLDFSTVQPVLQRSCNSCHSNSSAPINGANIVIESHGTASNYLVAGEPYQSKIFIQVVGGRMPIGGPRWTIKEMASLYNWIKSGAPQTGLTQ